MNDVSENNEVSRFLNRELSWLNFNQRVLELAMDPQVPLLERVKFLAITASNLDEFFQVRVGSLKRSRGSSSRDPAGLTADEQLSLIRKKVIEMNDLQDRCLIEQLDPALAEFGIVRLQTKDLDETRTRYLRQLFHEEIDSTISRTAFETGMGVPLAQGAKLYICVRLKPLLPNPLRDLAHETNGAERQTRHILIPLPKSLSRLVTIPSDRGMEYIFMEEIIGSFLEEMFPQELIEEWTTMRITRNADFELDDDSDDFFLEMKRLVDKRSSSTCVRLRVGRETSPGMIAFLKQALEITDNEVFIANGPLDLTVLFHIASLSRLPELRDPQWIPTPSLQFQDADIFERISERDQILFHPYQSYDPVVELLQQAARDPNVLAIKQTLYRTSRNSKIVMALGEAAENGKSVTAIVELKARFDEERNMDWAQQLERQGVDVVYGIAGFKVHAKLCIVVRREHGAIKRYVHFGTGNYNESTSTLYSDVSYFTCDHQMGMDAVHAFNAVTGLSIPQKLEKLAMAPIDLRESIRELIAVEIENANAGGTAQITAKLNSLVDPEIINDLYHASQKGVKIRLNVRGICCLRPGVGGLSENIRVVSVIDRFLEHSRIICFRHGGDQKVLITSADWMGRNLDRRVEMLIPVEDPACQQRLTEVLETYFQDNVNAWELQSDGSHRRLKSKKSNRFRAQQFLYEWFHDQYVSGNNPKTMVFKAIRGSSGT